VAVIQIRSALFSALFLAIMVVMSLLYLPLLALPRRVMVVAARWWVAVSLAILKHVAGVRWQVRGRENLPGGGFLVAAKHQSAFETFAFRLVLDDPAYVLKRELTWIPFFGWYLAKSGVIAIDRGAGAKALKAMVKGAQAAAAEGRPVIIFPEGTRTAPGHKLPYHSGVAMLYGAMGTPVVPVALNSGMFWGRRSFLKRPGTIIIEFLPAIAPGMDRKAFMAELESRIETASDRLVAEDSKA
jgi:1-acyl-sn-glycerol-3-phosphate acyltransferase